MSTADVPRPSLVRKRIELNGSQKRPIKMGIPPPMSNETIYLFEDIFTDRFALSLHGGLERLAALSEDCGQWVLRGAFRPEDLGWHYPEARRLVARHGYCICRISNIASAN